MSLPPGFLDELRTRLSIGQVVGRKVMWDTRKSNQGKGDLWAPCPFHQEKSASFHVDDRKGFYYCFGCHAKGDAITFVRETENVEFMEAVKILAAEAGMPVPASDPRAQEKADKRTQLMDIMEQAVQWHRLQLRTGAASDARDYLARRGFDAAGLDRWDIGFAPANGGVMAHLVGKGVDPKLVIEAGLAAESDRGGSPYDRFRGRIIFPIRDGRARAIGLGGRAMDPNARAKYLNSPETPLFDKGRSLYNHGPAREAALDKTLREAVQDDIGGDALEKLMRSPHIKLVPSVRKAGDVDIATQSLREELAKLMSRRGHLREISDGMDDLEGLADEGVTWRLSRAAASVDTTIRKDEDDSAEYDKAENGALLNKSERSALDDLLGKIGFAKDE